MREHVAPVPLGAMVGVESTRTRTGPEVVHKSEATSPVFQFQRESPDLFPLPSTPTPPLPYASGGGVSGGGPPSTRTTAERRGSTSGTAGGHR